MTAHPPDSSNEARAEGANAYWKSGGNSYRNPYPPASAEFNDYERGWMQSLKRDDRKVVLAQPEPAVPPTRSTPPESTYNAYADVKGRSGPRR